MDTLFKGVFLPELNYKPPHGEGYMAGQFHQIISYLVGPFNSLTNQVYNSNYVISYQAAGN